MQQAQVNLRNVLTTKSQDLSKCANCYQDVLDNAGEDVSQNFGDSLNVAGLQTLKIGDVIGDLLDSPQKLYLSSLIYEDGLTLCGTCVAILKELYFMFGKFLSKSQEPSFIHGLMKSHKIFKRLKSAKAKFSDPEVISLEGEIGLNFSGSDVSLKSEEGDNELGQTQSSCRRRKSRINYATLLKTGNKVVEIKDEGEYTKSKKVNSDSIPNSLVEGSGASKNQQLFLSRSSRSRSSKILRSALDACPAKVPFPPNTNSRNDSSNKEDYLSVEDQNCSQNRSQNRQGEHEFICPACDTCFALQSQRDVHMKTQHPDCTSTQIHPSRGAFNTGPSRGSNTEESSSSKYQDCSQRSTNQNDSLLEFSKLEPFQCDICLRTLKCKSSLRRHKESHQGNTAKTFPCEICGKFYKSSQSMKDHKRTHNTTRSFSCNECGLAFKRRYHLKEHTKCKHGNLPKQFVCPEPGCNKAFHRIRNLRQHRVLHSSTLHLCELGCGAKFKYKYNRHVHQKKHCPFAPNASTTQKKKIAKTPDPQSDDDAEEIIVDRPNSSKLKLESEEDNDVEILQEFHSSNSTIASEELPNGPFEVLAEVHVPPGTVLCMDNIAELLAAANQAQK